MKCINNICCLNVYKHQKNENSGFNCFRQNMSLFAKENQNRKLVLQTSITSSKYPLRTIKYIILYCKTILSSH